jgi:hypothetical protein
LQLGCSKVADPLGESLMAECAYCKSETELFENGTPICVSCAAAKEGDPRPSFGSSDIQQKLLQEVREATDRMNAAAEGFSLILKDVPSNVPSPDSTFRITQASHELSAARAKMLRAHRRLNDFLSRGVIPEDLDQAGSGSDRE